MGLDLRVASIGYSLRDPRVADIDLRSKQTLLDKDVVLLRPANLQYLYSPDWSSKTHMGALSLSEHDSPRIDADIERRRREIDALLARGGTLVLFLPAPDHWYIDTGRRTYSGTGRNRQTTTLVSKRDLFSLFPFAISAEAAESRDLEVVGGDPFASFWRGIDGDMEAAAYLASEFGHPTLRIRGTEAVVGSIAKVGSGSVIVLPQDILYYGDEGDDLLEESEGEGDEEDGTTAPPAPETVRFLDALFELVREVRVQEGDFSQPEWASGVVIGAELQELAGVAKAEARADKALAALDKATAELARLQRRKALLFGTGKALETVVGDALEAIGFEVAEGIPGRTDRVLRHPKYGVAVAEVKGKGKSASERDCAQLEKWVSEHHLAHEEKPKPILVVNAWRDVPVHKRTEAAFPNQLIPYAEARKHCLVTSTQLLGAWLDAEAHPAQRAKIAKSLVDCVGRFERYVDWREFIALRQALEPEQAETGTLAPTPKR